MVDFFLKVEKKREEGKGMWEEGKDFYFLSIGYNLYFFLILVQKLLAITASGQN